MKQLAILLVLVASASLARADEALQAAAAKMMEAAYVYLGVAYICEDALGTGHYYAARSIAEAAATKVLGDADEAVLAIEGYDSRIKSEHKKKAPAQNAQKCLDNILKSQTDFRVAEARFDVEVKKWRNSRSQ